MKDWIRSVFRRLFFYSSRQLWRRWRTYLSVFFTSVFLLALVMCALELFQSYLINQEEQEASGTWHARFLDSPNDLEEKIARDSGVKEAWTVTWTSRLASSVDATAPGKLAVLDEETQERFNIRWLWGHAPEDGEIAVSRQFFEAYGWLEADTVCDLWFKAGEMTYQPLKLAGIYIANDKTMPYVFVSKHTAAAIDRETGAHPKYDSFFTVDYVSDRFVAKIVDRLYRSFTLGPTEEQAPKEVSEKFYLYNRYIRTYKDYINPSVTGSVIINAGLFDVRGSAMPSVTLTLPVIVVAALILASFMRHWTAANAPEFGVLGAIGATRRNLCTIAAGQVLLIALISSPPVILFSILITKLYINAYNAATLGTGLVFFLPWGNFIEVALWFAVLSCVFTYLGIAQMTREEPYILMTGSYRGKMPFVRTSSLVLSKIRDKVARLALIETMRQIRGDVVQILVTGIVSVVIVVFAVALGAFVLVRSTVLSTKVGDIPTETRIASISRYDDFIHSFWQMSRIPESMVDKLRQTPGVTFVGTFTKRDRYGLWTDLGDKRGILKDNPGVKVDGKWNDVTVLVTDEAMLPYLMRDVRGGDPDSIFSSSDAALYIGQSAADYEQFAVGETFTFAPQMLSKQGVNSPVGEECEFTVTAALTPRQTLVPGGNCFIVSRSGADRLGICPADECGAVYLNYDPNLSDKELTALLDEIASDPALMRFEITNVGAKNSSEQSIRRASMMLVGVFCGLVYVSFAVMSVTHAKMKMAEARRDIAIKRQLGADDRAIYRSMRIGSYPASAIAIALVLGLALLIAIFFILLQMASLNIMRDSYPLLYPPNVYAEYRNMIFVEAGLAILVSILSLPVLLFTAGTAAAGTVPPTRAVLKEPITEGLRKGTD